MSPTQPVAAFLADVRANKPAAIETFHRYSGRLLALAANHLNQQMRRKVDPEDVLQSVLRSFFTRHGQGQLLVGDWGEFWAVLVTITVRKCADKVEHFQAARRDVRREVGLAQLTGNAHDSLSAWDALARDPTPSEAVMLAEAIDQLASDMTSLERRVLTLMLEGRAVPEIGQQIGRTQRTVRRQLASIKRRLRAMDGQ